MMNPIPCITYDKRCPGLMQHHPGTGTQLHIKLTCMGMQSHRTTFSSSPDQTA